MGSISLAGVVVAGPDGAATGFPGSEITAPLMLTTTDYLVSNHAGPMKIDSDETYVPIAGVGSDGSVTHGLFLYLRTDASIDVRITTTLGVSAIPVSGLVVLEFSSAAPMTALEVRGVGRVEYLVAGQS